MGAAGDMLMGALYELYPEKERFLADMNALIPGVKLEAEGVTRQGIAGTHMRVDIHGQEEGHERRRMHDHHQDHHHEHRSLADIHAMIDAFPLPEAVREKARRVYGLIAQAEAEAHGVEAGEVHFHEVGALDAVIDVTGVCYLLYLLAPDAVCASPVTMGSGTVRTAHGLLPVPAPATAKLLTGVPVTAGDIQAELCTPTGAALLRTFAGSWGVMPDGVIQGCGHGCGTKDFPRANCLRAFLVDDLSRAEEPNDEVTELKANIGTPDGGRGPGRVLRAGGYEEEPPRRPPDVPVQARGRGPAGIGGPAAYLHLRRPADGLPAVRSGGVHGRSGDALGNRPPQDGNRLWDYQKQAGVRRPGRNCGGAEGPPGRRAGGL